MNNFVAIDFETANSDRSSICQIGITEVVDGVLQPSKSWLVKPQGNEYDFFNTLIHGIKPEDTKNCPKFPTVWKEVYPYLKDKIVIAHNTGFDMYALRDALDNYKIEYPTFDYFCTLRIARYIVKGCYNYSLGTLLNYLNIEFTGHHKADNDSAGCAKLLLKCLEIDGSTLEEMEEKYHFHRGKFAPNTFIPHLALRLNSANNTELLQSLEEHPELVDKGNYFYGKNICFTGTCSYGNRKELLQKVKDIGGIPSNSVTKKTEVLVVGQQDYRVVGEDGMSNKQEKAYALLNGGQDIEILSEIEFLKRLGR